MAKLTRKTARVFGETATATGADPEIGQFGSAKKGTYNGTGDIDTIQGLDSGTHWSNGWIDAVTPSQQFPPLPEMTGVHKVLSYQSAYLLQEGIAEYDSGTTYYIDSLCKGKDADNNLVIYRSKVDENIGNAVTNTTYWEQIYGFAANQDLSNLSLDGNNRLHALKSYSDEGELLTDAEGLADVTKYAHSTFDSTKFTVSGSPNIADDGIASGFSDGNYIKTNQSIPVDKDFVLKVEYPITQPFLTKYSTNQQYLIGGTYNSGNDVVPIIFEHTNSSGRVVKFTLTVNNNGANQTFALDSAAFDIVEGDVIKAILSRTDSIYKAQYYKNGVQIGNDVTSANTNNLIFASDLIIGQYKTNWAYQAWAGSIDLKQFSITVDDKPVFSGNKTGIDTIKPDDYTVVGTPTISADGVASGFSSSSYIKVPYNFSRSSGTFEFDMAFTTGSSISSAEMLITGETGFTLQLNRTSSGFGFQCGNGSAWGVDTNGSYTWASNTKYYIKLLYNGIAYQVYISTNNVNYTKVIDVTSNQAIANTTSILLGIKNNATQVLSGTIDLNAFKIYVDGNLVYQPCLKIPYTQSKTGSKVVDSVYRDRVSDMYEQYGKAPYYTLQDESKGNYTVVGSPTISGDFVASGFSASNYLNTGYLLDTASPWTIYSGKVNISSLSAQNTIFCSSYKNNATSDNNPILVNFQTDGTIRLILASSNNYGNSSADISVQTSTQVFSINTDYWFKLEFTGSHYILSYSPNGENYTTVITVNSTTTVGSGYIYIGLRLFVGQTTAPLAGSIDLNSLKIYVDNKLSYEAVTEPNFTLPMGEIYGLMATIIEEYVNGTEGYRVWSSGYCEQWGETTENTTITFLKPFKDTNYIPFGITEFTTSPAWATYDALTKDSMIFRIANDTAGSATVKWKVSGYIF